MFWVFPNCFLHTASDHCLVLTFAITPNLSLSLFLYQKPSLSIRLLCASASLFSHLSPAAVCLLPSGVCGDTFHPAQVGKRYAVWMSRIQFRYTTWLKKTSRSIGHIHTQYGASCAKLSQFVSPCPIANNFLSLPVALFFHPLFLPALSCPLIPHSVSMIYSVQASFVFFPPNCISLSQVLIK